jgi:hypothetical protein
VNCVGQFWKAGVGQFSRAPKTRDCQSDSNAWKLLRTSSFSCKLSDMLRLMLSNITNMAMPNSSVTAQEVDNRIFTSRDSRAKRNRKMSSGQP